MNPVIGKSDQESDTDTSVCIDFNLNVYFGL